MGDLDRAQARAKAREWQQRWRAANPERITRYRQSERERRAQYRAAEPEKFRQDRNAYEQRHRERVKAEKTRRTQDRERARDWAAANPERARERQAVWNAQNPERVRELKRNYYQRNSYERKKATREQNARRRQDPAQRERERESQAARTDARTAGQRLRRSNPEARDKLNKEQNERRRDERRRHQLGLPPRRPHHATINEREANAAAASAFFSRRRGPGELRVLREEQAEVGAAARLNSDAFWATSLVAQIRTDERRPARAAAAAQQLLATAEGARLREEVRMDSVARKLRGAEPYANLETEARRRALAAFTTPRPAVRDGNATLGAASRRFGTFGVAQHGTPAIQPGRDFPAI